MWRERDEGMGRRVGVNRRERFGEGEGVVSGGGGVCNPHGPHW